MSTTRGRPAGRMTPLRKKALAVIQEHVRNGRPLMVSTVARRLGVDRRSARRIITDVNAMAI